MEMSRENPVFRLMVFESRKASFINAAALILGLSSLILYPNNADRR